MEKFNLLKIIYIFMFICFTQIPCFAFEYTIDTAREEALKGIPKFCIFPNKNAFQRSISINHWDESSILSKQIRNDNPKLLDIVYKDTPAYKYTYKYQKPTLGVIGGYQGFTVSVSYQAEKSTNKIAAYQASTGKLMTIALNVSENEAYFFDMDGNLLEYIRGNEHKKFKIPYSTIKKHMIRYSGK